MSVMIEAIKLTRHFGEIKAVDGVSFQVRRGDVLGFLGPNGAGKSTTMKMLTGFLTPSAGQAKVAGFDVVQDSRRARAALGYLPENAPLYGEMSVGSFLKFVAEVRGLSGEAAKSAISRVVELTSLQDVLTQRVETLSKGFRRRVGLAQALVHDPDILILDEPTDGLDPNQKHEVRSLINAMENKCVVLSTHILEEVDAVCNRVVIIANGKLVADETPLELKRRSPSFGAVTLTFSNAPGGEVLSHVRSMQAVAKVGEPARSADGVHVTVYPKNGALLLPEIVREAEKNRWTFSSVRMESGHLDEVFRSLTGE